MSIYKLVIREYGTLDSFVDGRIYSDPARAIDDADEILAAGWWNDRQVGSITIYKETADLSLGWFRTTEVAYHKTCNIR